MAVTSAPLAISSSQETSEIDNSCNQLELHVVYPYTFEEAFARYQEFAELYGHLGSVSLYFRGGEFTLTYYNYERTNND